MQDDFPAGFVWLVGAGPGDPELLTRKAERLIRQAEVIFYDALVSPDILALGGQAEWVSVGKRAGRHSKDQGTIDALLVEAALAGRRVLRLKERLGLFDAPYGRGDPARATARSSWKT